MEECRGYRSVCGIANLLDDGIGQFRLGEKVDQLAVDLLGVSPEHAMRAIHELHELHVLDHRRLPSGRRMGRQNAVRVSMQMQRGDIVAHDVLSEVLDPRVDTSEGVRTRTQSQRSRTTELLDVGMARYLGISGRTELRSQRQPADPLSSRGENR